MSVSGAASLEDFIATFSPNAPTSITFKYEIGAGVLEVTLSPVSFTTTPIEITNVTNSNSEGVAGEEFSSKLDFSATPEQIIFEWIIDGLPEGLTFNSADKTITGIPQESGTFEIEIIVSAGGMFDSRKITITIEEPEVEIDVDDVPTKGQIGETYQAEISAKPETSGYEWEVEGLPEGLGYRVENGKLIITGEPRESGIFPIIVRAKGGGVEFEETFTLKISTDTGIDLSDVQMTGNINGRYESEIVAKPENVTHEWEVEGLPRGLEYHIEGNKVIITGEPKESGSFPIIVRAKGGGVEFEKTFTLNIGDDTGIDFSSAPKKGQVSENYTAEISVSPEIVTYEWEIEGLPEGLTYRIEGNRLIITDTSKETGTFQITVTAKSYSVEYEETFTLKISDGSSETKKAAISPVNFPPLVNENENYSATLTVSPSNSSGDDSGNTGGDEEQSVTESRQKITELITEILTGGEATSIENITVINIADRDISDLSAITEHLTGLISFDCANNNVENVILVNLENLRYVDCWTNNFAVLDLSGFDNLCGLYGFSSH